LSALRTGRLYPPGNIPDSILCFTIPVFYPYAFDIVTEDLVIFQHTTVYVNSWNKPEDASLA
jgi:hypothetical protein